MYRTLDPTRSVFKTFSLNGARIRGDLTITPRRLPPLYEKPQNLTEACNAAYIMEHWLTRFDNPSDARTMVEQMENNGTKQSEPYLEKFERFEREAKQPSWVFPLRKA